MKELDKYLGRVLKWFSKGTKEAVFLKKTLLVLLAFYLIYRCGYIVGVFLSNIGL